MSNLLLFNKPFGVLSQFTDHDGHPGLAHHIELKGYYPAGRLDRDSEGLLLLTNDGALQAFVSSPKFKMPKTYWAQVEGDVDESHVVHLAAGVLLKDGPTLPAQARIIPEPLLWQRTPPVRFRKNIPTSWIELTITEGRNRQVRRMTAAIGIPTLRLVRVRIGPWSLDGIEPGKCRLEDTDIHRQNKRPLKPARRDPAHVRQDSPHRSHGNRSRRPLPDGEGKRRR